MVQMLMGFALIAFIAVTLVALFAGIATYWPYIVGFFAICFVMYFVFRKGRDKANQV